MTATIDAATAAADGTSTPMGASAQAQATGIPVEVTSETTQTNQVMAEPDGTFELTSSVTPVRVQLNGTWVPIDTALRQNADGTYSPAAATEQMAFSGGGRSPLVTLSDGSRSISFSWPAPLPAPAINGDTATYRSVLPGVDLDLTAHADSYSSVLVVHDATAAANPALSKLQFAATATDLDLSKSADGSLHATDTAGAEVFHGSPAIMWDSSSNPQAGPVPTVDDPGSGKVTPLGVAMSSAGAAGGGTATTTLTLTPPAGALTGGNVIYPEYIDPSMSPYRAHFAVVFNNGWHYYDDTSNDLKVGYCGWPGCNGIGTGRAYLAFDTSVLTGQPTTAHIFDATVKVYELHSAHACTPTPVDLYTSGGISSSTAWGGPIGSQLQEINTNNSDDCSTSQPGYVSFSNGNVADYLQTTALTDKQTTTVALRAPDESATAANAYEWKRFSSGGAKSGSGAQLVVTYTFPPKQPYGLSIDNSVDCPGQPLYVHDTSPTLHASAHDVNSNSNPGPNSPTNIGFGFHVWDPSITTGYASNPNLVVAAPDSSGNAHATWTSVQSDPSSNTTRHFTLPQGDFTFRVRAYSRTSWGDVEAPLPSDWYPFTVDSVSPAKPSITSFDYPANDWGKPQSTPGKIHFSSSDSGSGVAGFSYSFTGSGNEPGLYDSLCSYDSGPTTSGGRITASNDAATLTLPTLSVGPHTIYVMAFDNAHNMIVQNEASYTFYVAPTITGEGGTQPEAETLATSSTTPLTQPTGQNDQTYVDSAYPASWIWSSNKIEHLVPTGVPTATAPHQYTFSFTTPVDDEYELGAYIARDNSYGTVAFEIDGQPTYLNGRRVTYDPYTGSSSPVASHYVAIGYPATAGSQGGAHFGANEVHTVTVDITGKNASSSGYDVGVDRFNIVPVNFASYANITDAMNDHGTTDGTIAANFEPSAQHAGISAQDLDAALATAQNTDGTVTLGGATFTMPGHQTDASTGTDTADNVMADGQIITVPQSQTGSTYVDLLATSTCGAVVASPSIQLNVNFLDGTYSQHQLPTIPSWTDQSPQLTGNQGATITEAASAPLHRYLGTSLDANTLVHLYVIQVPTQNTSQPVKSIELPYISGSNFSDGGCSTSPKLHVFAIATS